MYPLHLKNSQRVMERKPSENRAGSRKRVLIDGGRDRVACRQRTLRASGRHFAFTPGEVMSL